MIFSHFAGRQAIFGELGGLEQVAGGAALGYLATQQLRGFFKLLSDQQLARQPLAQAFLWLLVLELPARSAKLSAYKQTALPCTLFRLYGLWREKVSMPR